MRRLWTFCIGPALFVQSISFNRIASPTTRFLPISTLARTSAFYTLVVIDTLVINPYLKIALGASLTVGLLIQHVVMQPATGCGLQANCCRAVMYAWAVWGFFVSALRFRYTVELDDVFLGIFLGGALLIAPLVWWANRLRARKFDRQDMAATILEVCHANPHHAEFDVAQKQLESIKVKE